MEIDLRREESVFVLTMNSGENRFNRASLDALNRTLDEVEGSTGSAALVTVGGTDKFYSNGLDLNWMMGAGASEGGAFVADVMKFLGRVLTFPVPTVAAMNGHTFAAGAMMALAHDFRVMRADRGYFCLPEVDINIPFAPGMMALIQSKLDIKTARDLMLTGKRIGGDEAAARQVVDESVPAHEVLPHAIAIAATLVGKDRNTYGAIKRAMYAFEAETLRSGAL